MTQTRNPSLTPAKPSPLFLTNEGEPINPDSLTEYVRRYIDDSGIGKRGSCHLFRHTMATLMLEHGADIRYIQAMLGHAKLTTTEIYTQVSIRKLRQIHELTHPADHDREEPDPDDLKATGDDSDAAAQIKAPTPAPSRFQTSSLAASSCSSPRRTGS